ncbi:MAG: YafY family transcriptional regulator [Pseudonocardia sp.]|nr:YafY family transcriptional regulator [Pseudonocardia sp.]
MSSARAERLVNLVLCLLSTRQFLTAERIRGIVPGYADAPNDEAFFRMFERDKNELRELGVPLETRRRGAFDAADGYRIARSDYELADIDLAPDEATAVALAARLWDSPELAGPAHGALRKLRAAGVEVEEDLGRIQPRASGAEPAFAPLLAAVQAGRLVTFDHRRGGLGGEVVRRVVEPWGVVSVRGRWYVVGYDQARQAPRSFRLSRIRGPVTAIGPEGAVTAPPDVDLVELVRRGVEPAPMEPRTALLWVAAGAAHGLRRLGTVRGPAEHDGQPGDEVELELRSVEVLARWVAGHGPDAVVLAPPELAEAVRARLHAAAAAHAPVRTGAGS